MNTVLSSSLKIRGQKEPERLQASSLLYKVRQTPDPVLFENYDTGIISTCVCSAKTGSGFQTPLNQNDELK